MIETVALRAAAPNAHPARHDHRAPERPSAWTKLRARWTRASAPKAEACGC